MVVDTAGPGVFRPTSRDLKNDIMACNVLSIEPGRWFVERQALWQEVIYFINV